MNIEEARESIEKRNLFRKERNVYFKTYEYIVDILVDETFKYYNILKIELKEDEMLLFSPTFHDNGFKAFKYSEMETFQLRSSVF